MDAKMMTVDYVSKYTSLLSKQLYNNQTALAPLRVSILCSQHNQNSQLDEIKSMNPENCCQYCLTPWKYGNFILKTLPKRKYKNGKIQKKHSTVFNIIMKCLVCLNKTSSEYKKIKILNKKLSKSTALNKSIDKTLKTEEKVETIVNKNATVNKSIDKTSKIEEKVGTLVEKKPKKKKRTLYAGLNPLVFKNLKKNIQKKNNNNDKKKI
ncbi:uncharacterized protein LOC113555522 [Rhopalosiphum maidis]|uniref:uncharacterized protein LOC113555522 n=1 Tax=Rhopalosiphum maidis TaxID=43146 RepID=UPI000F0023DA|nr:uncharacterized protein LOC113555522 [Rhopalosiphum maidis]